MTQVQSNERGAAMVLVLGVIAVLAVLAIVVVTAVVNEKKTAFFDYSATRSFYSADAATEAGVQWLRRQPTPAPIIDGAQHVRTSNTFTAITNDNMFRFDIQYVQKRPRPGWSLEYKDYQYTVQAVGASARSSEAAIDLAATRLYREGY